MNKLLLPLIPVATVALIALSGHRPTEALEPIKEADSMVVFTPEVRAIIDNKCYGCHSNNSKGAKSRKKLNWDSLNLISRAQKANKMDDVVEVLSEDEMPPQKFLEKEPGKKLTLGEKKLMEDWADRELNKISR
ncbi:MAG: heme-binding domain-containing protein, partial [Bacteroidota bacterium]